MLKQSNSVFKLNRLGPWFGIGLFVFLAISVITGNTPQASANGAKVIHYYTKHRNESIVGTCATMLAVISGLMFFGYLYAWLRRSDTGWLPIAVILGGVTFAMAGLISAGGELLLIDQGRHITPDTAKALNVVGEDLPVIIGSAGIAVFTLAIGLSIRYYSLASRWWSITAFIITFVAIVGFFTPFDLIGIGIWVLAFSIRLIRRKEDVGPVSVSMAAYNPESRVDD